MLGRFAGLLALILLLTGAAIAVGAQRPQAPLFAFAEVLPDGTNRLHLYDVRTRATLPIGRLDRVEVVRWFADGSALAVGVGLGNHWAVYHFEEGWRSMNDGLNFANRIPPYTPTEPQLVVRSNDGVTWNVYVVNPANREDVPVVSLQSLMGSPSIYWAPDREGMLVIAQSRFNAQLAYTRLQATERDLLVNFPPGSELDRTYFSPQWQWTAVVVRAAPNRYTLHMVDMTTGRVWQVSPNVNRDGVLGFLPPPSSDEEFTE